MGLRFRVDVGFLRSGKLVIELRGFIRLYMVLHGWLSKLWSLFESLI